MRPASTPARSRRSRCRCDDRRMPARRAMAMRSTASASASTPASAAWITRRALVRLAELLQAPVATSMSGKGVISETHPLAVGWGYGPQGTRTAEDVFKDHVDIVLAMGVKFSEVSTGFFSLPEHRQLIHVDINREQPGPSHAEFAVRPRGCRRVHGSGVRAGRCAAPPRQCPAARDHPAAETRRGPRQRRSLRPRAASIRCASCRCCGA